METKTIRFEKGQLYPQWKMAYYHGVYDGIWENFLIKPDEKSNNTEYYECLKSFTVQINIIEDEKVSFIKGELYHSPIVHALEYLIPNFSDYFKWCPGPYKYQALRSFTLIQGFKIVEDEETN